MKDIKLVDDTANPPEDLTHTEPYRNIAELLATIRGCLYQDPAIKDILLKLLLKTHQNLQSTDESNIGQPKKPTITDIDYFLENRFPTVHLVATINGKANANADKVYIWKAFVTTLSAKMSYGEELTICSLTVSEMRLMFICMVIHEVAHCVAIWWGKGQYDSLRLGEETKEAGIWIEHEIFGGLPECMWTKGLVGSFFAIKGFGFDVSGEFYSIAPEIAASISKLDASKGLPLISFEDMKPVPYSEDSVRCKVSSSLKIDPPQPPSSMEMEITYLCAGERAAGLMDP